jgi:hypothetical protein
LEEYWMLQEKEIKILMLKIFSKWLKGEVNLTESLWQEHSLYYTKIYLRIIENMDFVKGVQPNDASVIYNIQCLKGKLETTQYEACVTSYTYSFLKKGGRKVSFVVPHSSGPEMSLEMVEKVLDNLELEKWTLETLKGKIPAECKSAVNKEESFPDIDTGYQDVIKAFEVCIFYFTN